MTVIYEWSVELTTTVETEDKEAGEVLDSTFWDSYHEAKAFRDETPTDDGQEWLIVLVRDDDNGRSWAYMEDGVLPEMTTGAYSEPVAKVPQKFHKEVAKEHKIRN